MRLVTGARPINLVVSVEEQEKDMRARHAEKLKVRGLWKAAAGD